MRSTYPTRSIAFRYFGSNDAGPILSVRAAKHATPARCRTAADTVSFVGRGTHLEFSRLEHSVYAAVFCWGWIMNLAHQSEFLNGIIRIHKKRISAYLEFICRTIWPDLFCFTCSTTRSVMFPYAQNK